MAKSKIITVHSAKGGVGKTTTSLSISHILARLGFNVLLVDVDPHTACTNHLSNVISDSYRNSTIRQLILNKLDFDDIATKPYKNVDFIPSQLRLQNIESELASENNPIFFFYEQINNLSYDFIVIDTPGNVGFMTRSAMLSSDYIIIPSQLEAWPIEALEISFETITRIKQTQKYIDRSIEKILILPTFFEERRQLSSAFHQSLKSVYSDYLSNNVIHRAVSISKTYSTPGAVLEEGTRSYLEYLNVVKEIIEENLHG